MNANLLSQQPLYTVASAMSVSQEPLDQLDGFAILEQSSPESLKIRHPSNTSIHSHQGLSESQYPTNLDPSPFYFSRHSSVSSFPASVIHNVPFTDTEDERVLSKSPISPSSPPGESSPIATARHATSRDYASPFRNPSSVRAMQMETDYSDSDTPLRKSPRAAQFSPRRYSPASSLHQHPLHSKRQSRPGTPSQLRGSQRSGSRLKREFPLVLLHCTVLEPKITDRKSTVAPDILEAVLPFPYNKRWRVLLDKVHQNSEIKQRGVLVSHPHDDYELLEERILETLELQRPRLRQSHYLGQDRPGEIDSGFESAGSQRSDDDGEGDDNDKDEGQRQPDLCAHKCPDCGKAISLDTEQERKYEIKIYAANGLMKAGAWAAAWSEMEKVDIEIAVWMPEDVRSEVDARLAALDAKAAEPNLDGESELPTSKSTRHKVSKTQARRNARTREIYGSVPASPTLSGLQPQDQDEAFDQGSQQLIPPLSPSSPSPTRQTKVSFEEPLPSHAFTVDQPSPQSRHQHWQRLLPSWTRFVVRDQRNLVIAILSVFVISFATSHFRAAHLTPEPSNSVPASLLLHTLEEEIPPRTGLVAFAYEHAHATTTITSSPTNVKTEVLAKIPSSPSVIEAGSVVMSLPQPSRALEDVNPEALKHARIPDAMQDARPESDYTSPESDFETEQDSKLGYVEYINHEYFEAGTTADTLHRSPSEPEHVTGSAIANEGLIDSPDQCADPGGVSKLYSTGKAQCDAELMRETKVLDENERLSRKK